MRMQNFSALAVALLFVSKLFAQADMHPNFLWRDSTGASLSESGAPLSLEWTCGTCHDVDYIEKNSSHAGMMKPHRNILQGLPKYEKGMLTDLWEESMGGHLAGGGEVSKELDCLVCHVKPSDWKGSHDERMHRDFGKWRSASTLLGTPLVIAEKGGELKWNFKAKSYRNSAGKPWVKIGKPNSKNCAQCHSGVFMNSEPFYPPVFRVEDEALWASGLVYSPGRISNSDLHLAQKDSLHYPWDIHAAKGLQCSDCHNSPNNPAWFRSVNIDHPARLQFDVRRDAVSDYLYRPDHKFPSGGIYGEGKQAGASLDCSNCHDSKHSGQWSRRSRKHFEKISCEGCHVPAIHSPVLSHVDATLLDSSGKPRVQFRNMDSTGLVHDFKPLLLRRKVDHFQDGRTNHGYSFYPYNPVNYSYWKSDGKMIARSELQKALEGKNLAGLSDNARREANKKALLAAGFNAPEVVTEIRPHPVSHNVVRAKWAVRRCSDCHAANNILTAGLDVGLSPLGKKPVLQKSEEWEWDGELVEEGGSWHLQREVDIPELYVFGSDRVPLVDFLGILSMLLVLGGIALHGGLRILAARRNPRARAKVRHREYMYSTYERFWHWMQAMTIGFLLYSGMEIHLPSTFSLLGFEHAVWLHNAMGIILAINAFLAMFYHLASGDIRQFLPEPKGFFNEAMRQQLYYLSGIFKGDEHPFHKNPENKLNPLQQITYLGLLNILLPIQVLTGFLMFFQSYTFGICEGLGGLQVIAAMHTLCSWFMASFVVMHIYLTTTGDRPTDYLKAMITGWEESDSKEER